MLLSFSKSWRFLGQALLVFLIPVLIGGCVTPSGPTRIESELLPRPGAKIVLGTVTAANGVTFEKIDAVGMLREAMLSSLSEAGIRSLDGERDFSLNLQITDYRPGNAFKRWLLPGWGSTVLAVRGELKDIREDKLAATITHKRSVPIGGVFSIGAWKRIFAMVANDIAEDLKRKVEQGGKGGGGFVVSLSPWADRTVSVKPPVAPIPLKIAAVEDKRTEIGRIGERFAAFNVSMGDVYFSRKVPDFIHETLTAELGAMGYRIVDTGENLDVKGELNKFWVYTKTTPIYWDIIAEIGLKLSIQQIQPDMQAITHDYACKTTDRTYVWPSEGLMGNVLGKCLEELMGKIRSDNAWKIKAVH